MREERVESLESRRSPDINVTSLIDVLLVLLIIFMVITPLKPSRLESKVPEKPSPQQPPGVSLASLITLSVDQLGHVSEIRLNHESVTTDQLQAQLRLRLDQQPPERKTVFIQAPRQTIYGEVVGIIDLAKSAGASPIGLQLDHLPDS